MMKILMLTEELPRGWEWDPTAPITGTCRFYVNTAEWLSKLGHIVDVEMDRPEYLGLNGVGYFPRSLHADGGYDVVLLANYRGVVPTLDPDTRIVNWTSFADFRLSTFAPARADACIVISAFAGELAGDGSLDSPPCYVVPLGIDKNVFVRSGKPKERKCVYTSSPDRGGDWLQAQWNNVYNLTGYRLECTGYSKAPRSEAEVVELLQTAEYWLHPGQGTELFCLSAAEAQACGAVPIIVPHQALHETVKWGYRFPPERYLDGLVSVLQSKYVASANADHVLSWEESTRLIEEVLRD